MTRDEFMERARREIDQAFAGQKNRMMNLVQQAWAEGKRAAETDAVARVMKAFRAYLDKACKDQTIHDPTAWALYQTWRDFDGRKGRRA